MSSAPHKPRAAPALEPLLLAPDATVTCPACHSEFSLADGFASRSLEQLRQASGARLATLRGELEESHARQLREIREIERRAALGELAALKESLAERDARIGALIERDHELEERARRLSEMERGFEARVGEAAQHAAHSLSQAERARAQGELEAIRAEAKAVRERELGLLHERAKLLATQESAELDAARRVEVARQQAEQHAREVEGERWRLREAEYQKKLDDTVRRLEEAQRSAAQGSQQLQGEVLELVLEEQLRAAFPLDLVEEVKKGARGGDVVQRVMTRGGQHAGTILWEAKRAQNWSREWCVKLREDQRALGAEVGVLVSQVLPRELAAGTPFDLHEEVWVAVPGAALSLAKVLRSALTDVHKQRLVSVNRGEKMEAVYDYVTSAQFGQKVRAIASTLKRLREELESERAQTQQRWARREKQIQQAVLELAGLGGDLQGLAQQDLPQLELEGGAADATDRPEGG